MDNQAITLTFGDRAENHHGMEIIGQGAEKGFSLQDLQIMKEAVETNYGVPCNLVNLHVGHGKDLPEAYLLIIPNGCKLNPLINYDGLCEELIALHWDDKALMKGKVVNKKARHNLCFDNIKQDPDYENGKGTIIAYSDTFYMQNLKNFISRFFNAGELKGEGNFYYDLSQCGIGFHGDSERKKVIAVRLGTKFPLCFQWFQHFVPISERMVFNLGEGDIYIMSEKAVGTDWKRSSIPTLRHSAGCDKYTYHA